MVAGGQGSASTALLAATWHGPTLSLSGDYASGAGRGRRRDAAEWAKAERRESAGHTVIVNGVVRGQGGGLGNWRLEV